MKDVDKIINLYDLFLELLKNWRKLLIVSFVCSFVVGCCGFTYNKINKSNYLNLEVLKNSLSYERQLEVEAASKIIKEYETSYDDQISYNINSIYQNINPYDVETIYLKYYVKDHDNYINETNTISPVAQAYVFLLDDDALYEKMSLNINSSIEPRYYSELVYAEAYNDLNMFEVKIVGNDSNVVLSISNLVKEFIENSREQIQITYGAHDLILASEKVQRGKSETILKNQEENIEVLTSIETSINDLKSSFSGDELTYLKLLLGENIEGKEENILEYFIIGLFVGFVIESSIIIIIYIFSNRICSVYDLKRYYNLTIIGGYSSLKKRSTKIDSWVYKQRGCEELPKEDLIGSMIALLAKNNKLDNVYLICNDCKELNDLFLTDEVSVKYVSDINSYFESKEIDSKSSGIILVEELCVDKFSKIENELSLAEDFDVKVLGVIVKY